VRNMFGSKSKARVIALSNNATMENDVTKPAAIIAGRALAGMADDAPSRIGSIGSVQRRGDGDDTRKQSDERELSIRSVHQVPVAPDGRAGSVMFFRDDGRGRYACLVACGVNVHVRLAGSNLTTRPPYRATRLGGIPAGSLEVTWEVRTSKTASASLDHQTSVALLDCIDTCSANQTSSRYRAGRGG